MRAAAVVCLSVMLTSTGCKRDKMPERAAATEADYAATLIDALQAAGDQTPLRFDPVRSQIVGAGHLISTANLYQEWLALPAGQRDAAVARVAASFIRDPETSKPRPLAEVRDRLLPRLAPNIYFDEPVPGSPRNEPTPNVPVGEAAGLGVVIDSADFMQLATREHLAEWKLTIEQAAAIAVDNLGKMAARFEQLEPGVWGATAGDNYDSARLLLVDDIRQLNLAGTTVALVPNRETLLLASSKDARALLAMAIRAEKAAAEPRRIHTIPLCLGQAGWTECIPDVTFEVRRRYRALALQGWAEVYEDQKAGLQKRLGEDVFVASFSVLEQTDTGERVSYAILTKGVPTMLPRAEMVALVDIDAAGEPKDFGLVPWDQIVTVAGPQLTPDHNRPQRWATGEWFPSAAELTRLVPSEDPFARQTR